LHKKQQVKINGALTKDSIGIALGFVYLYVCVRADGTGEAASGPQIGRNKMIRALMFTAAIFTLAAGPALSAEPIVGSWKRPNGTIIKYDACGNDTYCGTVMTGEYKGKSIGSMSGKDGSYKGKVNKLDEGKTYTGKASVKGNTLSLSGCVMGGLICKSENLARH
jgi:uncharacterized protein (DUF2147 family)